VDWIHLAQVLVAGCCERLNEPSGSVKDGMFLSVERLSVFQE
jgi:hypothetical protein